MHLPRRWPSPGAWLRTVRLLILPALLAGCDDSTSGAEDVAGSYVGRVAGSNAFVTVITNGADVRAYVCDGTPTSQLTLAEWFKGTQSANGLDLTSVSGRARLVASVTPGSVTGRIEGSGVPALTFTAPSVGGDAGFYLFKDTLNGQPYWAGWIVASDGEQRGSMAEPTRTSLGVSLNLPTRRGQLPGAGTVEPGRLTPGNVVAGFNGGCTGTICF